MQTVPANQKDSPIEIKNEKLKAALLYAALGWSVVPLHTVVNGCCDCKKGAECTSPGKHPRIAWKGGQKKRATEAEIRSWWAKWPDANPGGLTGEISGIIVLDVDEPRGVDTLREHKLAVPLTVRAETGGGGWHHVFNWPGFECRNFAGKIGHTILPNVDFRGDGGLVVLPPSNHKSGRNYAWIKSASPEDIQPVDAPSWLLDLIKKQSSDGSKKSQIGQPNKATSAGAANAHDDAKRYVIKYGFEAGNGNRNSKGYDLASQLRDLGLSIEEAEPYMLEYADMVPQNGEPYTEDEALASLKSAYQNPPREPAPHGKKPESASEEDKTRFTDLGNTWRFTAQYGELVRYTQALGWLVWDGKRWARDETGRAMLFAKQTVKAIFTEAEKAQKKAEEAIKEVKEATDSGDEREIKKAQAKLKAVNTYAENLLKWGIKSQSRSRIEAITALAQSEPEIAVKIDCFDDNQFLLNAQNGVIDLESKQLRSHNPKDLITKIVNAPYDPGATCPLWLSFLDKIFAGKPELISFIQRAVGYTLTGSTCEQVLFFLFGNGKNGKSTFISVLQTLMNDYACKISSDTILAKKFDSAIPNDIARLKGSRLTIASELPEGRRLNENLVKDLTGGEDVITARFLHHEFFEFSPSFKIWMYGNHKPVIRGQDDGIWRRIMLIPFDVVIKESERDKNLPGKLRAELPGILNWAVEGCLLWQKEGLTPPEIVLNAVKDYRSEQDTLSFFIEEKCTLGKECKVVAKELFEVYKLWCEESNEHKPSRREFSDLMKRKGLKISDKKEPGTARAIYEGIELRKNTVKPDVKNE